MGIPISKLNPEAAFPYLDFASQTTKGTPIDLTAEVDWWCTIQSAFDYLYTRRRYGMTSTNLDLLGATAYFDRRSQNAFVSGVFPLFPYELY